jgi:hypothetical protein
MNSVLACSVPNCGWRSVSPRERCRDHPNSEWVLESERLRVDAEAIVRELREAGILSSAIMWELHRRDKARYLSAETRELLCPPDIS